MKYEQTMNRFIVSVLVIAALLLLGLTYYLSLPTEESIASPVLEEQKDDFHKCYIYGYDPDSVSITCGIIEPNEFLADILLSAKVSYAKIDAIARVSKDVFDVRNLRAGGTYTLIAQNDSLAAHTFIYQNSPYFHVVYDLQELDVNVVKEEIDQTEKVVSGTINGSLWLTMDRLNLPYELISKMEQALAWSVDFYHVQPSDSFKLIYEEQSIKGNVVGVGTLKAAYYKNYDNEYYSIWYQSDQYEGFFDECGRPMKKAFLKAPVEFSRISSRYNPRRFHPVLKRVKPHLGTDYAAPRGTPIRSVADGVVLTAGYTRGNGNYVKIKHDKVYTTQYLHMSKFAKGIRSGVHVKQGQTIGYVGSTGLATGPHVCYRFWKNGRQVDPLRENLPPPDPMADEELPSYFKVRDRILTALGADVVPESSEFDHRLSLSNPTSLAEVNPLGNAK